MGPLSGCTIGRAFRTRRRAMSRRPCCRRGRFRARCARWQQNGRASSRACRPEKDGAGRLRPRGGLHAFLNHASSFDEDALFALLSCLKRGGKTCVAAAHHDEVGLSSYDADEGTGGEGTEQCDGGLLHGTSGENQWFGRCSRTLDDLALDEERVARHVLDDAQVDDKDVARDDPAVEGISPS